MVHGTQNARRFTLAVQAENSYRMILTEYLDKMRNNLNVYDQKNTFAVKVKSSLTLKNVHNKEEKSFILPKQ